MANCYLLTSCDGSQDSFISNSPSLESLSGTSEAITLMNYSGCWTVSDSTDCDCSVAVTIISRYTNCLECTGYTNYKLINCDNSSEIIYTSDDLSDYVGKVIKQDSCPGCWRVTEIKTNIPINVIDIDEQSDVAIEYGIRGVPTLLMIDENENVTKRMVGMTGLKQLQEWFDND